MKQYNLSEYKTFLLQLNYLRDENLSLFSDGIVKDISYNSKEVIPGTLFICKGIGFKEDYLKEAIKRGAIGYVSEQKYELANAIPGLIVTDIRKAMPELADFFFNSPSKQLKIIAVGGTKGKTTTTHFIKTIIDAYLKEQGKKESGLISSIKVFDGLAEYPASNTTPEAIPLQRYLANAVQAGLEFMVIEVSSQALKYSRVDCIQFEVGVFLNISKDHISPREHKDFEDYFESKMRMFKQTKKAVINADSDAFEQILVYTQNCELVSTYSKQNSEADFYGVPIESNRLATRFEVSMKDEINDFYVGMPGTFNFENALAALAATSALDIPIHFVQKSLENIHVPGRMEFFESEDKKLTIVVDYAHNKLSFESLYPMLRSYYPDSHMIAIFGVVGGKALNRRQELSDIVGKYADGVIFTMIHPDQENPDEINRTLMENIKPYNIPHQIINDREKAIQSAIESAEMYNKTLVVVTGRGQEDYQIIQGRAVKTLTDGDYVKKYLKEYNQRVAMN